MREACARMIPFPGALPLFRPPAEADSFILRVAEGCPHNACAFCGMYRGVRYRERGADEIRRDIAREARRAPGTARVFLADGDAMRLPFAGLRGVLSDLAAAFPRLARVNAYANGRSIAAKSDAELRALRAARLHTLYMGLESGDDAILRAMGKAETAGEMIEAARRAAAAGLKMSVMVLLGLGGREGRRAHALATAAALNAMQPPLLSALRAIPVPGTPLARRVASGSFRPLSEREAVLELRDLLDALRLERTVFRANHASNVMPLEGRLPRDREALRAALDARLEDGGLDADGPGPAPLWL